MKLNVTDIDECKNGNHRCKQICHNTYGSYKCQCYVGYSLMDDRVSCQGDLYVLFHDWMILFVYFSISLLKFNQCLIYDTFLRFTFFDKVNQLATCENNIAHS